jgi:hypothetical protein
VRYRGACRELSELGSTRVSRETPFRLGLSASRRDELFPCAFISFARLLAWEAVVRKVREPETASPTRETHALPGIEIQATQLVARTELVYRNVERVFSCAANFLVSDSP